MNLFGWEITKKEEENSLKSISSDMGDGSAIEVRGEATGLGGYNNFTTSFDTDTALITESQLITKYREMAMIPEVEKAIDIIINEVISSDDSDLLDIDLGELDLSENVKDQIAQEFEYILNLMNFNHDAFDILKRWYVDGKYTQQVVVDEEKQKEVGISKLVYLDPRKIKKVTSYKKTKDIRTSVDLYSEKKVSWIYSDDGFIDSTSQTTANISRGVKLSEESVVQATSGQYNSTNTVILSYLHKAIRPINQLRSLEDSSIIYRIARAPERRIFYIDVGNLPTAKAEQVLHNQMTQYKSKMVYDTNSGTVKSEGKTMTMVEDYWLPRRSDGKATEITTLPAGGNLGEMEEVTYFLNKLYNSLNVPITRMDPQAGFAIGRNTEVTRDEVALMKMVKRLRKRFGSMLLDLLERQLALKNISSPQEFQEIRNNIRIVYNTENYFDEMVDAEVWDGRLRLLDSVSQYVGVYFSEEWVNKNILHLSDEDIKDIKKQVKKEPKKNPDDDNHN